MKRYCLLLVVYIVYATSTTAQSIGIGTMAPHTSAVLEINSNNKGLLIPTMSAASRDAIVLPATGLIIYQPNAPFAGFYYNAGVPSSPGWIRITNETTGWGTSGNIGTNPLSNFIGTTDDVPFNIRVNNQKAGGIDHSLYNAFWGYKAGAFNTTGFGNTAIGDSALSSNSTGNSNTANGRYALASNSTGSFNTAYGKDALLNNTSGVGNTALGASALASNITGASNTAIGINALANNQAGDQNIALGLQSLLFNNAGNFNIAIGSNAMVQNTTGNLNIAIGSNSLRSNNSGNNNIAIGIGSLRSATTQTNLVAIGDSALFNNGMGASASIEGTQNTAIGSKSLFSNSTGAINTAIGFTTLYSNTTGHSNTAGGSAALYSNTTGVSNSAYGNNALYSNTTGGGNTANGNNALYSNTTGGVNTAIGGYALFLNNGGSNNTGIGTSALHNNISGNTNVAVGVFAMMENIGGESNTAVGHSSGRFLTYGTNNTFIGYNTSLAPEASTAITNATAIGANAKVRFSNSIILGDENTVVGIGTNFTPGSGYRLVVNGAILTSSLYVGVGTGTAGDVYTVDANGLGGWKGADLFKVAGLINTFYVAPFTTVDMNQWDTTEINTGSSLLYNNVTGEYNIPANGYYRITTKMHANMLIAPQTGQALNIMVKVNGITRDQALQSTTHGRNSYTAVSVLKLVTGDKVKISVRNDHGNQGIYVGDSVPLSVDYHYFIVEKVK